MAFMDMSPPAREAWIEISGSWRWRPIMQSPPAREAWIEMLAAARRASAASVASREGGVD